MATKQTTAYLALGANLGDRYAALCAAVGSLKKKDAIAFLRASPVYEAEAHTLEPDEQQPAYLNAVVEVCTTLTPEAILAYGHRLEQAAGRERHVRWMPRTLDVDLLVYGRTTRRGPGLILPHPRLDERRFVLQPWADLAPNLYVPAPFDATVEELLLRCPDPHTLHRTGYRLL